MLPPSCFATCSSDATVRFWSISKGYHHSPLLYLIMLCSLIKQQLPLLLRIFTLKYVTVHTIMALLFTGLIFHE